MLSLASVYKQRFMDRFVRKKILSEPIGCAVLTVVNIKDTAFCDNGRQSDLSEELMASMFLTKARNQYEEVLWLA
jgi:hypothetical protein